MSKQFLHNVCNEHYYKSHEIHKITSRISFSSNTFMPQLALFLISMGTPYLKYVFLTVLYCVSPQSLLD